MDQLRTIDWLTLAAIILGPILAVQVQQYLERRRDLRARRLNVFHTLMATRAARVSQQHVQALNMIDIEFSGRRAFGNRVQTGSEKAVTNAWKSYSDHLNHKYRDEEFDRWIEDGDRLFAKLLFEISRALGYDFDEVELRRNVYSPVAHGKLAAQEASIRDNLQRLLSNQSGLAVVVYPAPEKRAEPLPPTNEPLDVPPLAEKSRDKAT
jgi:hypothetical protein